MFNKLKKQAESVTDDTQNMPETLKQSPSFYQSAAYRLSTSPEFAKFVRGKLEGTGKRVADLTTNEISAYLKEFMIPVAKFYNAFNK
jgi:hypothetical protein